MDRADVLRWVEAYERAWRTAGIEALADLFTADATYLMSPFKQPIEGLDAIGRFWDAERDGPEEAFDMDPEIVAVDGDTAVVRLDVVYAVGPRWRDLWILRFAPGGRCAAFEEWPFSPKQADGH